jgi:hypothetical protein
MRKFTLIIAAALGMLLAGTATSHADGKHFRVIVGAGGYGSPPFYYGGPGFYYSPSWYYDRGPHYYYGRGYNGGGRRWR